MIQKLTKEQAIIVSGYTGKMACNFSLLHEDIEKRLGRPIWTHEFGGKGFETLIQGLYREDFIAMCYSGE